MDDNDKLFLERLFAEQTAQFQAHVDVLAEHFDHKISLVAEGHRMLSEKLERVESTLALSIDRLHTEIVAHRTDTEAHLGAYKVLS